MSDKRAIYAIGVIVAAFALVFGMVAGSTSLTTISVSNQDPMRMSGHVTAVVYDSNGNIKSYFQTDNKLTDDGRNCAADLVFGTSFHTSTCAIVNKMAIGSSSIALDPTDTDLFLKTTNTNEALTLTGLLAASATAGNDVIFTLSNTFIILSGDDGENISETGLFDDEGNMFARTLIGPIPVTTGDKITVNWELIID